MIRPAFLKSKIIFFVITIGFWIAHVQGMGLLWSHDCGEVEGSTPTVAIAPDVSSIVCAHKGSIVVLNQKGERVWSGSRANIILFSNDSTHFVAASDQELQYFSIEGELIWKDSEWSPIRDVAITPDGKIIGDVAGGRINIYDNNGNVRWDNRSSLNIPISISISDDGTPTVVGYFKDIGLFDYNGVWRGNYSTFGPVNNIEVTSPDAYIIASDDNILMMFYRNNLSLLWSYKFRGRIRDIAISRRASYIVAGGDDRTINVFNTSGALLWNYDTGGVVNSVDIIPDGSKIVMGSNSKKVIVFNNQKQIILYQLLDGAVKETVFSNDGHYLAAVTVWGTVYFFELTDISQRGVQTTSPTPVEGRPVVTNTTIISSNASENNNQSMNMTPIGSNNQSGSQGSENEFRPIWVLLPLLGVIAGAIILNFLIIKSQTRKKR